MSASTFKAQAYIKDGCPFCLKFLIFMAEAKLLDEIEIVRLDPASTSFEATKSRLAEGLGKPATFPTVEIEPARYRSDSDALIAISFRFFSGESFTFLLAGFALNIIFSPVNGLMPSRAFVAGFFTTFIFNRPGNVNRP